MFSLSLNGKPSKIGTSNRTNGICSILSRALGQLQKDRRRSPANRSPRKRTSDESSEADTIQQILANLRKGYLMIKHSADGAKDRFIYLSPDDRYLCWKPIDRQSQQKLQIIQIQKIVRQGVQFYLKGSMVGDARRCLVVAAGNKRLQLEATSEIEADYLKYELERVIRYWKGMRLNYKYTRGC